MSAESPKRRQMTGSYALANLFVWVTLAATLTGVVVGSVASAKTTAHVLAAFVTGGVVGGVVGSIIGLYHHRRLRGFSLGLFAGVLFGAVIGLAFAGSDPQRTVVTSLTGTLIIIGIGVAYAVADPN